MIQDEAKSIVEKLKQGKEFSWFNSGQGRTKITYDIAVQKFIINDENWSFDITKPESKEKELREEEFIKWLMTTYSSLEQFNQTYSHL